MISSAAWFLPWRGSHNQDVDFPQHGYASRLPVPQNNSLSYTLANKFGNYNVLDTSNDDNVGFYLFKQQLHTTITWPSHGRWPSHGHHTTITRPSHGRIGIAPQLYLQYYSAWFKESKRLTNKNVTILFCKIASPIRKSCFEHKIVQKLHNLYHISTKVQAKDHIAISLYMPVGYLIIYWLFSSSKNYFKIYGAPLKRLQSLNLKELLKGLHSPCIRRSGTGGRRVAWSMMGGLWECRQPFCLCPAGSRSVGGCAALASLRHLPNYRHATVFMSQHNIIYISCIFVL